MDLFSLVGRSVVITGAGGLLGSHHAMAVAQAGGLPLLVDVDHESLVRLEARLRDAGYSSICYTCDVTDVEQVRDLANQSERDTGRVWGLINNVAANPTMRVGDHVHSLMGTPLDEWESDLRLGITSAWLCGREFGSKMASHGGGSIVNISSDLAVIAPDQRIYEPEAPAGEDSPRKPASYVAAKSALRGLSRYFATYWSPIPVRSNCLMPGSARGTQSRQLVSQLEQRIPLARLADPSEYSGAVVFMLSDAAAYMTGAELVIDGGRSAW